MEQKRKKGKFSIMEKLRSSNHAWRGVKVFFQIGYNARLIVFFGALAVYTGFVLNISAVEWSIIVWTLGLVLVAEMINTAIEIDIDLTSPDYHPYAKDTKDVAAAAVLVSTVVAGVAGLIVFLPKILLLLS